MPWEICYIFCLRTWRNWGFRLSILASISLAFKLFLSAPRGHSMHPFIPLLICGFPNSGELHCSTMSRGLCPPLLEPSSEECIVPLDSLPLERRSFIPSTEMILKVFSPLLVYDDFHSRDMVDDFFVFLDCTKQISVTGVSFPTLSSKFSMAVLSRILRSAHQCLHKTACPKTLTLFTLPRLNSRRFYPGPFEGHINRIAYEGEWPRSVSENIYLLPVIPAFLAGLFGFGMLDVAYADANETGAQPPLPSESPSSYVDLEEMARKERHKLEEMLKSKGVHQGFYPRFTVAVKGQKVTIKFQIPPTCEIPRLIANIVSNLGHRIEERGGSDMILRAWDSAVAWQLTLDHPKKQKLAGDKLDCSEETNAQYGDLCILIFRSLISSDKAEIEFIKQDSFTLKELEAFVSVLQLAGSFGRNRTLERKPTEDTPRIPHAEKPVASLESLGVRVYGLDESRWGSSNCEVSWDNIAGYDEQKREIEDTILLALRNPEVYDDVARGTRCKFESNRPRAVLFEGPPGTGKTSAARVIANQAGVPLLYVPLEVVMSKYYGESERLLGKVFSLANELPDGAIVFLDEVDSFAIARDTEMHEATRRILSVLLRQMDGFEQDKKVVVIAATNRKQDLDPALISRFDSLITFGLPTHTNRQEIAAQYAKHLSEPELVELATVTEELSGRDIRDVCLQAERRWASKIIRGNESTDAERGSLPPLEEYLESAIKRKNNLLSIEEQKAHDSNNRHKQAPLDMS